MKSVNNQKVSYGNLSRDPERQRKAIAESRANNTFDGEAHLLASPIGRAVKAGFPLARR